MIFGGAAASVAAEKRFALKYCHEFVSIYRWRTRVPFVLLHARHSDLLLRAHRRSGMVFRFLPRPLPRRAGSRR
jgi:hypothetical protein